MSSEGRQDARDLQDGRKIVNFAAILCFLFILSDCRRLNKVSRSSGAARGRIDERP